MCGGGAGSGGFKEETGMPGRGWGGAVRYGLPGLLLGLALASGVRGGGRELWAQGPHPAASSVPMPAGPGVDRSPGAGGGGGGGGGGVSDETHSPGEAL